MKIIFLSLIFISSLFSKDVFNMKGCEVVDMSKYTKLFSCHKIDYLVEYKIEYDIRETDSIKRITMITENSQIVLKTGN